MGSLMPIPPDDIVYAKLTSLGADVNSFQVNQDRTVMIYDASYESHAGKVPVVPALFIFLCVSGGGFLRQETTSQALEMDLAPGDICIVANEIGEHTSELQSPVPISYAVFCLKKKKKKPTILCYKLT